MTTGVGRTILLVEDDASVRKLVSAMLHSSHYEVLTAGNGPDALGASAMHPGRIDLIITDFGLGEMNGLELADRIAARRPGLKVLVISGYSEINLPPGIKESLQPEFLPKPFTMDALLSKVGRILVRP